MAELTIISHNVKGLNSPTKRSIAAKYYRNFKADIIALQETHLAEGSPFPYLHKQYSQVYYTTFHSKRRGKSVFFHSLFTKINQLTLGTIILMGDFNMVMSPTLDKTPSARLYAHKPPATFTKSLKSLALVDTWRSLHPSARDYTFFSYPHRAYSRIDYFFTPVHTLSQVTTVDIHPITWSDHAAIGMSLIYKPPLGPRTNWRLNEALLSNPTIKDVIANDLENYFITNLDPALSMSIIWAAHKATIRGSFIKLGSMHKKKHQQTVTALTAELRRLEDLNKSHPTPYITKKLQATQSVLTRQLIEEADKSIRWTKQRLFIHRDKPDTLLARKLNNYSQLPKITALRNSLGRLSSIPQEILQTFRDFYSDLYGSPQGRGQHKIDSEVFLDNLDLPKLDQQELDTLNAEITSDEVEWAIKRMKLKSSPGPDGFLLSYYKQFATLLVPHLTVRHQG
ncbi:hypothetical protein XELAEV_18046802mg [Xenopus laevis]|uniref:Endonuclease/exonuclease/phosphatase domain-containing protein n=1 Tax=Xenopus laevis TaxID=8355 RepID=A0A974BUH3_XENLA|nr:hypothetical protein XELAEV_18046802mg [Xenopus laevis]